MAKCGIEKYDELPPRVALIDVDAARYALGQIDSDNISSKLWLWHPMAFVGRFIYGEEEVRQSIVEDLDEARRIHKGELDPQWTQWKKQLLESFSDKGDDS